MGLLTGNGFSALVNGKSRVLGGIYTRAYNDLIRDMNDFGKTPFARDRAQLLLRQVDDVTKKLDAETRSFINKQVPETYFTTAKDVKTDIRKLKIDVGQLEGFATIHYQATDAMASDAMLKFGHTMTGVKRSAEEFVKFAQQKSVREIIGAGQLQGRAAAELAKEVSAKIAEDGITALIDKGGKKWQLDTYAEMLTRQVLANSGREGVFNTAQEYGFDLAIITTHGTTHDECRVWEGKIISLTGKTPGYPSLQDAIDAGLFHVGCKHGYTITFDRTPKSFVPQNQFEDVRIGDEILNVKDGHFYRTMDAKEYAYMMNRGELAPTPEGLFEHGATDNRKYFGADPSLGKMIEQSYAAPGQSFTIAVPVSAMPPMRNDPKMKGAAVYVTEPIPLSKIRLVK